MASTPAKRTNTPPPRPIIVRKIIAAPHGGHHGGAWKVAYADFVTAMMAFFLLMWLLGATDEKARKGIADYFAPTLVCWLAFAPLERLPAWWDRRRAARAARTGRVVDAADVRAS